jgi:PAS domain S-box-containing protein
MTDLILHIIGDLGLLALLSLGAVWLHPLTGSVRHPVQRNALLGVMFGALTSVVMLDPILLPAGATIDARAGPALLAGIYAGPVGAVIANAIGAAVRYWVVGGPVALGGAVGFLLYGSAGLLAGLLLRQRSRTPGPLVLLGVALFGTVTVLPSFFVSADWATGLAILEKAWPILLSGNVLGTLLVGVVLRVSDSRAAVLAQTRGRAIEADTLALVARTTTNGVLIADADGRVEWMNVGFDRMTGRDESRVIGRPLPAVLSADDRETGPAEQAARMLRTAEPFRAQARDRRPDGQPFWADIECRPLHIDGHVRHFVAVLNDITRQKILEQRLLRAEEVARVGHWRLTVATGEVEWSGQAHRIFGLNTQRPTPDLDGVLDIYMPEDRARVMACVDASITTGVPLDYRARLRIGDTVRCVAVKGEVDQDPSGNVVALFGVVQDITDLVRSELEANRAREAADAANRSKSEFLATMSHELRTPLNAVIGFSEVIATEMFGPVGGDPRYRAYAADIHESGQILLDLVNDVLDLSKIEAGRITLEDSPIDLDRLADRALRLVRERAARHGLTIRHMGLDTAPRLRADSRLVTQMLFNLATNAVKFTPAGGTITVFATVTDDGGLILGVRDTGIGIPAEDLPRVTEPYVQVRSAQVRPVHKGGAEGTGLGLTLVRSMMELHDGWLELESTVGLGTTARLVFPPERTDPIREDENTDERPDGPSSGDGQLGPPPISGPVNTHGSS